jgi:peptidoglycan/xylan/chitin deacetylase (PgdA/CDA1 family)
LNFFLRHYEPVCLNDVIAHLHGFAKLPKRCFIPTFDDGFREIYEVIAPILFKKGIPAVYFLVTSTIDNRELCYLQKKSLIIKKLMSINNPIYIQKSTKTLDEAEIPGSDLVSRVRSIFYRNRDVLDKIGALLECEFLSYLTENRPYLTSGQVSELMKQGFEIGAHSVDHPLYSELSIDEQLTQTRVSLEWLSHKFNFNCRSFAFPYGDIGISPEYFQSVFSDNRLELTMGTGGILNKYHARNLPRFGMERTQLPASKIIARQFGRAFLRR